MVRGAVVTLVLCFVVFYATSVSNQTPRTLVAVWAHADDETPIGPILARYAREGAQVVTIIATDGAQGGSYTSVPRGPELARVRAEEARCAAAALGARPPILLEFPDAQLGNYADGPTRLYQLTERLQAELARLQPNALITWGPDGGTGHPDHRLVSSIVTQLVRAGAPGASERLFYASIPEEGARAVNPARGAPPMMVPQSRYFTTRIAFTTADADAARRAMACHKTQYSDDVVERVTASIRDTYKGEMLLTPWIPGPPSTDLFR